MTTSAPIVQISDMRFCWPGRGGFSLGVDRFELAQGQSLLLLGASGSGKSTLLSLICGTLMPDAGVVQVRGTALSSISPARRDTLRAEQVGVIFQQFNLLPFATVADNITLPLRFAPARRKRAGPARAAAAALCRRLGLPDDVLRARAATLSVGQQQRVAVARALIGTPPLVIADEPTSALDEGSQTAFLDLLFEQVAANGSSLLMVSHDPRLAPRFDRCEQISDIAQFERPAA